MTRRCCDKCKHDLAPGTEYTELTPRVINIHADSSITVRCHTGPKPGSIDLCGSCRSALQNWLDE